MCFCCLVSVIGTSEISCPEKRFLVGLGLVSEKSLFRNQFSELSTSCCVVCRLCTTSRIPVSREDYYVKPNLLVYHSLLWSLQETGRLHWPSCTR